MNRLNIDGKLIENPEVRPVGKGKVTNFKILNKDGDVESTVYCEAWGDVGVLISNFRKDDTITVDGKLLENAWDDKETGKRRSLLKVRVNGCSSYAGYNTVTVTEGSAPQVAAQTATQTPVQSAPVGQIPF